MLCMLLTRASCVLCVWRPSEQMSGPWLPPVLTQLMLTPATYLVCQWMQTERAQYVQVRPQTTIERTPLSPFTSRILSWYRSLCVPTAVPWLYSVQVSCHAYRACVAS